MNTSLRSIAAGAVLLLGWHVAPVRADILYVSNAGGNYPIEKIDSAGASSLFADSGFGIPSGLAFDNAGNLYVAGTTASQIAKFTPGGVRTVFASGALVNSPNCLAFDSAGNLYASSFNGNTIVKITPGGVASVFASTGLTNPYGLAFDRAGNLYAANFGSNNIEKFTPGGVGSVFASTGASKPNGLAFDSMGNLYEESANDNTIEKFTPGGIGLVFASGSSSGLFGAAGLAFDSAGNLYAANSNNSTIAKFTATAGVLSNVASVFASSGLSMPQYLAFTNDAGVPLPLANQVPEPSTTLLGTIGLAGFVLGRRRNGRYA